jgi:hypothetical protein
MISLKLYQKAYKNHHRMRDGYPLEALHRVREQIRRQHQQALAEALGDLRAAEEQAQEVERCLRVKQQRLRDEEERDTSTTAPRRAEEIQRRDRFLGRLRQELGSLVQERERACRLRTERERAVDVARRELERAEVELEAVRQNRAAWDQKRRREELRRAEQELEEITANRFGRGQG